MQMIADANLLKFYTKDDVRYGYFVTWEKHQGLPRAAHSKYPNPVDCEQMQTSADSCEQIPSVSESEKIRVREDSISSTSTGSCAERLRQRVRQFEEFWKSYPNKKSKGRAEQAWSKLSPDEQLHNRILDALERAKTSVEWTKDSGRFIPHPASWLNAKGWEDEYQPVGVEKPPPPPPKNDPINRGLWIRQYGSPKDHGYA